MGPQFCRAQLSTAVLMKHDTGCLNSDMNVIYPAVDKICIPNCFSKSEGDFCALIQVCSASEFAEVSRYIKLMI